MPKNEKKRSLFNRFYSDNWTDSNILFKCIFEQFSDVVFIKFLLIGIVVLTALPVQIRKKKQRRLITDYLNRIDTTLQKNICEATQVTPNQLKNYTVLGTGIASSKLYTIEEIISKMQIAFSFNHLIGYNKSDRTNTSVFLRIATYRNLFTSRIQQYFYYIKIDENRFLISSI